MVDMFTSGKCVMVHDFNKVWEIFGKCDKPEKRGFLGKKRNDFNGRGNCLFVYYQITGEAIWRSFLHFSNRRQQLRVMSILLIFI